ncbi:MAG: hypothetical protein OXH52_12080 [Gammaproteobacteria bacterium]|nr:hypothetical protein [Gammaproteobacteria bacterium]
MEEIKPRDVQFIGEQDGEPERGFKCEVSGFLRQLVEWRPLDGPVRAYLSRVAYPDDDNCGSINVALCFATKSDSEDEILKGVASIFRRMFGEHEHLDMMFVDNDAEAELAQVCSPFLDTEEADFVMTSSEGYGLKEPRDCVILQWFDGDRPNRYVLVSIDPPLTGQNYGLGGRDVWELVLASRHVEYSLCPITEWPAYVHVALPIGDLRAKSGRLGKDDLQLIGWGEIYRTRADIPSTLL